ncbi:MAG: hypothetical protein KGM96_04275 [Acidobacteriota bacterium]|nr:hypothetical protein [Acidobacteriota bacterium]
MKMKLLNRILIVYAAVLGGLALEYFRGTPITSLVIIGVILLMLANVVFFVGAQRARKAQ